MQFLSGFGGLGSNPTHEAAKNRFAAGMKESHPQISWSGDLIDQSQGSGGVNVPSGENCIEKYTIRWLLSKGLAVPGWLNINAQQAYVPLAQSVYANPSWTPATNPSGGGGSEETEATGMPGWVLPVAAGAIGIGAIVYFSKKKKK